MTHHICKSLAASIVMLCAASFVVSTSPGAAAPKQIAQKNAAKAADSKKKKSDDPAAKTGKSDKESKPAPVAQAKPNEKGTYNGPEVLDPSRFFGAAAMGYASAKACPEIVSKLFCYCGCDISDSHKSLVDCFTSTHGVDCHICQEEAVRALKMHRDNISLGEIQKAIDQEFASKYPWKEDSPTYKEYKASRLWKPEHDGASKASTEPAGPEPAEGSSTAAKDVVAGTKNKDKWNPVLKKGAHAGACCSKDSKDEKESEDKK